MPYGVAAGLEYPLGGKLHAHTDRAAAHNGQVLSAVFEHNGITGKEREEYIQCGKTEDQKNQPAAEVDKEAV
jgi:hypothetical protein